VHSCKPTPVLANDVFASDSRSGHSTDTTLSEFTINQLAKEFALTHRALRFYESRGLLHPRREGRRRLFSRGDRDRLALVLKGKKLGFTLGEISQMIDAEAGRASEHGLKLTAEKCAEQIAHFERQIAEAQDALKELRRIHGVFSAKIGG
jgi:DNA-binding transcriptional MerR regulator